MAPLREPNHPLSPRTILNVPKSTRLEFAPRVSFAAPVALTRERLSVLSAISGVVLFNEDTKGGGRKREPR